MPSAEEVRLAKWRRQGYGIWRITYSVDGFDESVTVLLPGRLVEAHAVRLGKLMLSYSHQCKQKHVHHLHTELES